MGERYQIENNDLSGRVHFDILKSTLLSRIIK